jgi:hypothetical protein
MHLHVSHDCETTRLSFCRPVTLSSCHSTLSRLPTLYDSRAHIHLSISKGVAPMVKTYGSTLSQQRPPAMTSQADNAVHTTEGGSQPHPYSAPLRSASMLSSISNFGNDLSTAKAKGHSKWRHTVGIILLLITVILWTTSNFLASVRL